MKPRTKKGRKISREYLAQRIIEIHKMIDDYSKKAADLKAEEHRIIEALIRQDRVRGLR